MTLLEKKLNKWTKAHPKQRKELYGFLLEYGSVIPAPPTATLNELLMGAYEAKAKEKGLTLEELLNWVFEPDEAEIVMFRIQIAT